MFANGLATMVSTPSRSWIRSSTPATDELPPASTTRSTLLNALASHNVHVPAACGGKGSCGLCKCKVTQGGRDILPTELAHLSRVQREIARRASSRQTAHCLAHRLHLPHLRPQRWIAGHAAFQPFRHLRDGRPV